MRALRLLRRPEAALFALVFVAYGYFYQAGGWNQNSRFALVRSTVERRTAVLDHYQSATRDLSCRGPEGRCKRALPGQGRHYYCDKAPGTSWLAVPAYTATHLLAGSDKPSRRYLNGAAYVSTLFAVGLPAAISVVMLSLLLGAFRLPQAPRLAVSLAYGLATLAFPYATLFYGHQLAASLLLTAFALLVRARHLRRDPPGPMLLSVVGLLLGFSVVVEYPAALGVAPICVYAALFVRPWHRLAWLAGGLALPGIALAVYHWMVFGGPLTLPYEFSIQKNRNRGFFMGLGVSRWEALKNILFTSYRGLFYSAPWLLLAVPGAVLLIWKRFVSEAVVCLSVVLLFVWLNASLVDWQGGWGMGPRYLIPAIPFLAIAAAGVAAGLRWRKWADMGGWVIGAGAVGYSAFMMLVGTAVKPEVRTNIQRPFEFLLERFHDGKLAVNTQPIDYLAPTKERAAWNLGELMGLEGLPSLLPLAILVAAAGIWLWWAVRRTKANGEAAERES